MVRGRNGKFKRQFLIQSMEPRVLLSTTVYVDANASGATHDGTSWATAYLDLRPVLQAAVVGTDIRVANGTYKPAESRFNSFGLRDDVALLGGYAGDGAPNPDARDPVAYPTILSGDIGVPNVASDNNYHVVSSSGKSSTAVLDGFVITGGNANGSYATAVGGGIYIPSGSPTIRNCTIIGNSATGSNSGTGGGLYAASTASTFTNCVFSGNSSRAKGGGLYLESGTLTLQDCAFNNNTSPYGAGLFSAASIVADHCSFTGNTTWAFGGGADVEGPSATFTNCSFSTNSATGDYAQGGGLYTRAVVSIVTDCTFEGNSSAVSGAGTYCVPSGTLTTFTGCTFRRNLGNGLEVVGLALPVTVTNCVFEGNTGDGFGAFGVNGGLITSCTFVGNAVGVGAAFSDLALVNCTFAENVDTVGGAIYVGEKSSFDVKNSVVYGNTASSGPPIGLSTDHAIASVSYSDVEGGWVGVGNLDQNPQFMRNPTTGADGIWGTGDDDYGDLRLQAGSPCIDAGDNTAVPADVTTDLAGNPRIVDLPGVRDFGERVDMGAYEVQSAGTYLFDAVKPSLRLSFLFDVNASTLTSSDLVLTTAATGSPVNFTATVSYDAAARTAVWKFQTPLPDGDYRATIPAGSVSDTSGNPLSSTILCNFFVLAGDANRDRIVDIRDLSILAANWQGSGKVFSQGDFNYDGRVDAADLGILSAHWQQALPPPPASAPASIVRAPTRTPVRMVSVVG